MNNIIKDLETIEKISGDSLDHLYGAQNSTVRFVFCGIQKTNKLIKFVSRSYPEVLKTEDLEFGLGIIMRSLLMDCILTLSIKDLIFKSDGEPLYTVKNKVEDACLKLIADGTNHLIQDAFKIPGKTEAEMLEIAEILSAKFPGVFEKKKDLNRPTLKKEYRLNLANLFDTSDHKDLVMKDSIYQLYSYYSKYDHLSHWTSLAGNIAFSRRLNMIDLSIVLTLLNLRDLLSICHDYTENLSVLDTYILELKNYVEEMSKVSAR